MPASSTAYGSTAPSAIDPFPIESVLAKIVGENNPANAQNMLNTYQVENQTSQGNYNYNLQQQHDFAKQQLAQQLKETYLKEAVQAVQHRGGTSVFNQLVGPDNAINPDLTSSIETGLTNAQDASTFDKAATGAYQAVQAGFPPNLTGLKSMTGGLLDTQGTPLSTTNLLIKEANTNARHGADANTLKLNAQLPADPNSGLVLSGGIPRNMTIPQYEAALKAKGYGGNLGPPGALPDRDAPPAGGATTSAPNRTSLPNAPASTTRAPAAAQPSGAAIRQRVEGYVENQLRISNNPQHQEAYRDLTAGKVGGKVNIVDRAPDGRPIAEGKRRPDGTAQRYILGQ